MFIIKDVSLDNKFQMVIEVENDNFKSDSKYEIFKDALEFAAKRNREIYSNMGDSKRRDSLFSELLSVDAVNIKDYISDLICVELISTPSQNDRIAEDCKSGLREFYKGFTYEDSISHHLLANGFTAYSSDNDNYSNEYHNLINGLNVTVSYIEGDVYLNIFLDNNCFNDYKLY